MPTFAADKLTAFATDLLVAARVPADEARIVAEGLVGANLRGHDSHGVMRVPYYIGQLEKGENVAGRELTILRESPTHLTTDGNWGLGRPLALRLTQLVMAKAKAGGIGVGTMTHASHVGRLGEYCELAAEAGLVSMMMVNSHGAAHRVAPPGGKASRLSTNPIAFGSPAPGGPLICDFSTSATAEGKVRVRKIAGEQCPGDWLIDSNGKPTCDPASLYANPPGAILPLGGAQSYKGFGLSLMVEILSGALSGGLTSREKPQTPLGNCVFLLAIDPAHFGGAEHFAREVGDLVAWVRSCPTAEGVAGITLPGDPERRVLAQRTASGVTIDAENWNQLVKLAERLKVPVPA